MLDKYDLNIIITIDNKEAYSGQDGFDFHALHGRS